MHVARETRGHDERRTRGVGSKQKNRSLSGKRRKSAFCQTVAGKLAATSGKAADEGER